MLEKDLFPSSQKGAGFSSFRMWFPASLTALEMCQQELCAPYRELKLTEELEDAGEVGRWRVEMAGALVSPLMSAPRLELPLRALPIVTSISVCTRRDGYRRETLFLNA